MGEALRIAARPGSAHRVQHESAVVWLRRRPAQPGGVQDPLLQCRVRVVLEPLLSGFLRFDSKNWRVTRAIRAENLM